jgi:hypothetical protein
MTGTNKRIERHLEPSYPHSMKTTLLLVALVGLLGLATGCKPSNRVTFKPALISIDPGEGWKQMEMAADPPKCSPRLMGKTGMINALHFPDMTDIKKVADQMQTSFSGNNKALPDSFKREDFATESGLNGIHLSYTAQSDKTGPPDMRSHSFVTHNRRGECVSISYITSPERESAATLEAIRKTLRVE